MKRTQIILLTIVIIAALIALFGNIGGTGSDAERARQAVEAQGYTNIQYIGVDTFACGQAAGFSFDADNANHIRIRVIACAEGGNGLLNSVAGWRIVTR